MTEEEAKQKWCPHGKLAIIAGHDVRIIFHCIASECMMWKLKGLEDRLSYTDGNCGLVK